MRSGWLVWGMIAAGCGSAAPEGGGSSSARTDPRTPGPMQPMTRDVDLEEAPGIDIHDQPAMTVWLGERMKAAHAGIEERVRLPVMRRAADFHGCDCPPYAIAPTTDSGPYWWITFVDLTSAGIPPGEWLGWVEGRFLRESRDYHSKDSGGIDVVQLVFEVHKQSRRAPDDKPIARYRRLGR